MICNLRHSHFVAISYSHIILEIATSWLVLGGIFPRYFALFKAELMLKCMEMSLSSSVRKYVSDGKITNVSETCSSGFLKKLNSCFN